MEMGHEVVVSTYWGLSGSVTQWNGITILPGFGPNYCTGSLGLHCQAIQPDLVITLGDIWVMDPNILRELPIVHWLPDDCRPMSLADRSCLDASGAKLMAMSKWGYDRFRAAGYNPVYVPHGIDTTVFSAEGDREAVRAELGVSNHFTIGMNAANNDAVRKAIPEQMLAFAKLHEKYPDTVLALHTGVHQEGGQDLEVLAENLGLLDCIRAVDQYRYVSGLITPEDLRDWYQAIDVLSACSYGEGFGLPIIEAQACETPVITTDASSMTELNPYGLQVSGEPFWNGVHKGWWIRPSVAQLTEVYEKSYLSWKEGQQDNSKLREFAQQYDKELVAEKYMAPAIEELLARVGSV